MLGVAAIGVGGAGALGVGAGVGGFDAIHELLVGEQVAAAIRGVESQVRVFQADEQAQDLAVSPSAGALGVQPFYIDWLVLAVHKALAFKRGGAAVVAAVKAPVLADAVAGEVQAPGAA